MDLDGYKEMLSKTNFDVFESFRGSYLFVEYDAASQEITTIVPFTTEEELKFLIASGIADNFNCFIELGVWESELMAKKIEPSTVCNIDRFRSYIPKLMDNISGLKVAVDYANTLLKSLFPFLEEVSK